MEFNFNITRKQPTKDDFAPVVFQYPLMAKSEQNITLTQHSCSVGEMALQLIDQLILTDQERTMLKRICFIAGIMHDLGKAAAGFQEMLKVPHVKKWPKDSGGFRHEILSAVLATTNIQVGAELTEEDKKSIVFSIVTHHKGFKRKYDGNDKVQNINEFQWPVKNHFVTMYDQLLINKEMLQKTWEELCEYPIFKYYISEGVFQTKLSLSDKTELNEQSILLPDGYELGYYIMDTLKTKSMENKKKLAQIRAILIAADHLASGQNETVPTPPVLKNENDYSVLKSGIIARPFQLECKKIGQVVILQAPTGSGKTEAAFFWIAYNQTTQVIETADRKKEIGGRVFYVLPYRASINAMYQRIKKWLDNKNEEVDYEKEIGEDDEVNNKLSNKTVVSSKELLGLQHSSATYALYSILEEEMYEKIEAGEEKDAVSLKILGKNARALESLTREIFYPIKITTPYQLLKGILQGRGWENIFLDFRHAVFVFDEIHAYDPHISGLILGMAKLLLSSEFSAKIFFMSATLPKFMIERIQEKLATEKIQFVEPDKNNSADNEIIMKHRHVIKVIEINLEEMIKQYQTLIQHAESVLIVVNTVQMSQKIYNYLNNIYPEEVMLLHSRFTVSDRRKKEKSLEALFGTKKNEKKVDAKYKKVRIVVATQVVEVSLDIDFEIGIIDGAPIDALVQRFGRVNRLGKRPTDINKSNILITQPSEYSQLIYNNALTMASLEELKKIENQKITETDLRALVNRVYQNCPWDKSQEQNFERSFNIVLLKEFSERLVPGSYREWIDDVIEEDTAKEVIWEGHYEQYLKKLEKNPVQALQWIIQVKVARKELDYKRAKRGVPPMLLKRYWDYTEDNGLQRKLSQKEILEYE